MRNIVKKMIAKSGWELRKIMPPAPSGMANGLAWLKNNDIRIDYVLDVGASNGCWTKECMEFFPDAKYRLYEPHPNHQAELNHFQSNNSNHVEVDSRAVGDREGVVEFDISDLWGASIDSTGSKGDSVEVELTTIDQSLKEGIAENVLIKLDTHGFERGILQGAENTLKKTSALIVECYNYEIEKDCLLFWQLCEYLHQRGFRPIQLVDVLNRKLDQSLWQMDIFFIKSNWKGFANQNFKA